MVIYINQNKEQNEKYKVINVVSFMFENEQMHTIPLSHSFSVTLKIFSPSSYHVFIILWIPISITPWVHSEHSNSTSDQIL